MLRVDDRELAKMVGALKVAQPELHNALRAGMRRIGDRTRDEVRRAAVVTNSSRIPRAVKTRVQTTSKIVTVRIRVDKKIAPHARVMEGKVGGRSARHPVFADPDKTRDEWTWVSQIPRPFFYKTIRRRQPQNERELFALATDAVNKALGAR